MRGLAVRTDSCGKTVPHTLQIQDFEGVGW